MKRLSRGVFVVAWLAAGLGAAQAPQRPIEFHRTLDEARRAKNADRPVVVLFGASWCGWCRKMANDTLTDAKVRAAADQFVWVKVDIDKDHETAARFGVEGVPVTVVLDKQGRVLGSRTGYVAPDRFVEFLTTSLTNPYPDELLPDLIERFARSETASQRKETAERLVAHLARPARTGREEMLSAVNKKGPSAWPVLLALMADKRLAVRAAAAGALKHAAKAELPYHPFAEVAVRRQQIAAWEQWLRLHAK